MSYGELTWRDNHDPGGFGNNCGVDASRKILLLCSEGHGLDSYKYTANGMLTHVDNKWRSGLSLGVALDTGRMLAFEAASIKTGIQPQGTVQSYSYDVNANLTYLSQNSENPGGIFPPYPVAKGIDIDTGWLLLFGAMSSTRGLMTYKYTGAGLMTWKDSDNPGGNAYGVCVDTTNKLVFLFTLTDGIHTYRYDAAGTLTQKDHDDKGGSARGGVCDIERKLLFVSNGGRELDVYSYDVNAMLTHIGNFPTGAGGDAMYGIDIDTWSKVVFLANNTEGIFTYNYTVHGACVLIDDDDQGGVAYGAKADTINHLAFLANWDRGVESYSYTFRQPIPVIFGKYILDAGVVYMNFVSQDEPGTLLGATRGGNVFTIEQDIKDIIIDGVKGPVKGGRRFIKVNAKLTCNFIEHTLNLLQMALPGSETTSTPDHIKLSRNLTITDDDYVDNIVIIAQMAGTDQTVICGVKNALADGNFEMGTEDSNERGLQITFTAHFDKLTLDEEPWVLMYPEELA